MLTEPHELSPSEEAWLRSQAKKGVLYSDSGASPVLEQELLRLYEQS